MSNTLIDLEGLKVFYTKILTEDLAEYARYDSLAPSAIIAPTLEGINYNINITNNDSRTLTFYTLEPKVGNIGEVSKDNFDGYITIPAGESDSLTVPSGGEYQLKAYTEDGTESEVYIVDVVINDPGSYV